MEYKVGVPITSVSTHPREENLIALGYIDGQVQLCTFTTTGGKLKLSLRWKNRLKQAVRGVEFSSCGEFVFAICSNKALCVYSVETGKRLRCLKKCHDKKPNRLVVLPPSSSGVGQQLATGDEEGQIRTWDFYADNPVVSEYTEQEDVINDFALHRKYLLASSADGTLAAYDFRNRQMKLKSETMHSELHSIAVTDKYTYVGALDNHIEVFIDDQYGNILERIETKFLAGVDALVALSENLLLAGSANDDELRFYHVNPHKALHVIQNFGGVERFVLSHSKKYLFAINTDVTLKLWIVEDLVKDVPLLRAQDLVIIKKNEKKARKNELKNDFFKDLVVENGEHASSEDDEDSEMDVDEEDADDEEHLDEGSFDEQESESGEEER